MNILFNRENILNLTSESPESLMEYGLQARNRENVLFNRENILNFSTQKRLKATPVNGFQLYYFPSTIVNYIILFKTSKKS